MATATETFTVSGIRCERCVTRLARALEPLRGLESASATLTGQLTLAWDDELLARDEIVAALARAGFHQTGRRLPEQASE